MPIFFYHLRVQRLDKIILVILIFEMRSSTRETHFVTNAYANGERLYERGDDPKVSSLMEKIIQPLANEKKKSIILITFVRRRSVECMEPINLHIKNKLNVFAHSKMHRYRNVYI